MFSVPRYIINLRHRIKRDKKAFAVYTILRVIVLLALIRAIILQNWESTGLCTLSLLLFLLPSFAEVNFKLEIPTFFEITIYIFIFAAEILGELSHFYDIIPVWDTMLHTTNGFLAAAVGLSMFDLLNRRSTNVKLSPFYLVLVAFCFSMTIGVLWEFCEFSSDYFFNTDAQRDFIITRINSQLLEKDTIVKLKEIEQTIVQTKDGQSYAIQGGYLDIGIIDTMKDLFVNFIGAIVYSIVGYIHLKQRDKANNKSTATKLVKELSIFPTDVEDKK